ncbi:hypothetical protein GE09DRAFT_1064676 [Coniochaeta sp. 2T2.1]|nr:hypothetical protein GE09DRAFT_1064676 [Coniochaeta sp. 2T2.1]
MSLPFLQNLPSLTIPYSIPRLYLISLCYLGAFSRFTHGRYTPTFYAYQIQHAQDDESTQYIPVIDTALGTLLLLGGGRTRAVAALLCTLFQTIGVVQQLGKGRRVRLGWLSLGMAVWEVWAGLGWWS